MCILTGAAHNTFSDVSLLLPSSEEDKVASGKRIEIVREYLRAFLDKCLKNVPATLLDKPGSPYPEIEVTAKR